MNHQDILARQDSPCILRVRQRNTAPAPQIQEADTKNLDVSSCTGLLPAIQYPSQNRKERCNPIIFSVTLTNMTTNTNTLNTLAEERIRLKAEFDVLEKRLKELDAVVIAEFQKEGVTKVETSLGKINLITNHTVTWNEEVLHEVLTKAQWERVTVRKVDKARLEAELTVGRISADEVDVAKSIRESKPFLR